MPLHWQAFIVVVALGVSPAIAAPTCPISYGPNADAKPNKLYLYFPPVDDASFPEFGIGGNTTSPLHRFDSSELPAYAGASSDLRNAIHDVVTDLYCEFNVQVLQTATPPPTTFARRNTVGVGTDANASPDCNGPWFAGQAERVDIGDATAVDFARVWAGTYQNCAGAPAGAALNGPKSTLQRWANSIGGTIAHEGGHNYGAAHADGLILAPGEDALEHHIMANGTQYSFEDRANPRHFSDHEYSLLASNVGLAMDTMWSWDFINPNAETGFRLRMEFLSAKPTLILSGTWTGTTSPWINPTLTGPSGTTNFKGMMYNRYQIEWSTGQPWSGGPNGQVPGGANFQIGATFSSVSQSEPDAIIISDVALLDASNNLLSQHPRSMGFDAGTLDSGTGDLNVRFYNFFDGPLIVRDVLVQELPRVISIDAMTRKERMSDISGRVFQPWPEGTRRLLRQKTIKKGGELKIAVARLSQKRHIFRQITAKDCEASDASQEPDARCQPGISVDLFPATTMYITAKVVDPRAKGWNSVKKRFVTGPVESQLFYQIAGRHPDLNHNGVDDFIDIRTNRSHDSKGNGVPDDARPLGRSQ